MKTLRQLITAALLLGSAVCLGQGNTATQSHPPDLPRGYRGLFIAPPRFELTLRPGDRIKKTFAVLAKGYLQDVTAEVSVMDWMEDTDGNLIPLAPGTNPYSAANWIKVALDPLTLKPEEPITVPFEVNIPPGPFEGSYWSAITFATKPAPIQSKHGIAVANRLRIWGVVYVTMAGTEKPGAEIRNFAIDRGTMLLDLENKGNVYLRLHPKLVYRNAEGEILQSKKLPEKVLLRESVIRYRIPLKEVPEEAVVAAVEVEAKGLVSPLYAEVALK